MTKIHYSAMSAASVVLMAVVQACGGGGGGGGGGTSGPPAPVASQLAIRVNPFGTRVGVALATQPIVEVQDASGKLFTSGSVPVTVAIGSGGGTLNGTTTVNSVAGVATFTDLSIAGTAGDRTLVFSAPNLASVHSSSFTLSGGVPAILKLVTPPPSSTQVALALSPQPVVLVQDDAGNPIATPTIVTASIVSGNGTVMSGSTATTGANGTATFSGLTLGGLNGSIGSVKLRFAASSTVFVDNDVVLGCYLQPITIGQSVPVKLTAGDCAYTGGGPFYKQYSFSVSSPSAISVTESGALTPFPHLRSELSTWNWGFTSPGAGQPETIKGLLSPGQYRAAASVGTSGATGDFTLTLNNSSLDVGCEDAIAFGTLALTQQLQTTDCKFTGTTQYYDDFAVGLPPGASVSASVSGTPFIPFVGVFLDTSYVAFQNGATSTGASTSYTNASTTGQFVDVVVSSTNVSSIRTGAYALALTITIPPGTSAAPNRIATAPMIPRSSRRLAIRTPPR